ncbi:hypothetical protein Bca101_013045 [Brassica carinata]
MPSHTKLAGMTPSLNAGPKLSKPTRPPPLELPCDVPHSRPQRRDVASRYLDTTSSSSLFHSSPYSTAKRCQSPNVTRTNLPASPSVAANRPQSTGRRQQLDRRGGGGEVSAAERMLLTSGRSLFSSFQADSSYRGNGNRSKLYPSPPSTPRRVTTVEKRKTASTASGVAKEEKSKLSDQWPRSCLSRSIDFMDTLKGSCNSVASRPLQNSSNSMIPRKISVDSLALPSKVVSSTTRSQITRPASPRMVGTTPTASSPRGASIARGLSPSRGPRVISPSGRMKRLYNSWISISKLYVSVRAKRIEMQRLKLNLKLMFILNRQIGNLEEWLVVEMDYVSSLVGAAEGLKGSTLCLPVDCVAKVNGQSMKDAISSAVDVMQAMASSICLLLPKVGKISCLAAELALVNIKEQEMLDVCRELLNAISALQVRESSFQTLATQLHT